MCHLAISNSNVDFAFHCIHATFLIQIHMYMMNTMVVVAPRLRATGLPCIASPETMSSGNTQHLGTENNRFIDASGSEFILQ